MNTKKRKRTRHERKRTECADKGAGGVGKMEERSNPRKLAQE